MVFCGFNIGWGKDWSDEIAEYVSQRGKGFVAIGEYDTYAQNVDFPNMTKITAQAGIIFQKINLAWAVATSDVVLDCIPDIGPID